MLIMFYKKFENLEESFVVIFLNVMFFAKYNKHPNLEQGKKITSPPIACFRYKAFTLEK